MKNEKIIYKNPNRPAKCAHGLPHPAGGMGSVMHLHPELEFLFIEAGRMENRLEGETLETKKGDIIFFNSRVPHATRYVEDGTIQHMVQFKVPSTFRGSFRYLSYLLGRTVKPVFIFHPGDADYEDLRAHFLDMIEQEAEVGAAGDYRVTADIFYIMSILQRRGLLPDERAAFDFGQLSKLVPLFEYIDEHFAEELSLESCAALLRLNKSYLCRIFRAATGTTLWDFINFVRVCKSEEMLVSEMSLSDIAYAAGFSSPSYFHRTFKKYKQISPSEFRKLHQGTEPMLLS